MGINKLTLATAGSSGVFCSHSCLGIVGVVGCNFVICT